MRFNAGQPPKVRERRLLQGLRAGEHLLGIDYRVARGELYALGASGQLYRIDVARATAVAVGMPTGLPEGREWGFDFNPTVDRIRVVSDAGANMRLHSDTGAIVDSDAAQAGVQPDGKLVFAAMDANAGRPARVVAAGYTYNKTNDKITTNTAYAGVRQSGTTSTRWYSIDLSTGKASFRGTVGGGEALVGAAIEP